MSDMVDQPKVRIRASFRQAFQGLVAMPLLSGTAIVALTVIIALFGIHRASADTQDLVRTLPTLPLLVSDVLTIGVTASVMVAIHRYILFAEISDRGIWRLPANYLRIVAWLLVVNVGLNAVGAVGIFAIYQISPVGAWIAYVIFASVTWIISLRLMLFFPALSAQASQTSLRSAWATSRGHVASFVWCGFLCGVFATALLIPVMILIFAAVHYLPAIAVEFQTDRGGFASWGLAALGSLLVLYITALGAVIAARFYQIYGSQDGFVAR